MAYKESRCPACVAEARTAKARKPARQAPVRLSNTIPSAVAKAMADRSARRRPVHASSVCCSRWSRCWFICRCAATAFVIYDDDDYVTENQVVQNGLTWAGVEWAFTTWHASNWHPLTWLSHMLDCELFGLNAGAQHLRQRPVPRGQCGFAFRAAAPTDECAVARRVRCRAVRVASAARGIRRVDFRTQGRVEHVLRAADPAGLCALCKVVTSDKSASGSDGKKPRPCPTCHVSRVTCHLFIGWR